MEPRGYIIFMLKQRSGILIPFCTIIGLMSLMSLIGPAETVVARDANKKEGVSKGEASQQVGQQGLGLDKSSAPILAGPETIVGSITKIQGDEYTIHGDRGQHIRIRVTTDTNKVCSSNTASVSSGQVGLGEQGEIPPTAYMQQRSGSNEPSRQARERDRQDLEKHALSPPTPDPSSMQTMVGSTDPQANEDVARGSGFMVGQCAFNVGDEVRVESSDMGVATTIKHVSSAKRRP